MEDKDKFKIDTSNMIDLVQEEKQNKKFKRTSFILGIIITLGFIVMICLYIFLSVQPNGFN